MKKITEILANEDSLACKSMSNILLKYKIDASVNFTGCEYFNVYEALSKLVEADFNHINVFIDSLMDAISDHFIKKMKDINECIEFELMTNSLLKQKGISVES